MDMTWATLVVWCLVAGPGIGFGVGWWARGKRDRRERRKMAQRRVFRRRAVRVRQAEEDTLRINRRERTLRDNGRKLPAVEGAGAAIRVHKMKVARSPKPQ